MKLILKNNGFTLPEVMIVITVLVIVSLAILRSIDPMTQFLKGYDTVRKSDLVKIKTAFEQYYEDHECYPPNTVLSNCGSSDLAPYLDSIPCDPNTRLPYTLYLLPEETGCAQKFAVYADISYSNDAKSDLITYCPDTIAVNSPDIQNVELIKGCSAMHISFDLYGCRTGSCQLLFTDTVPTCGFTYTSSDCNGVNCAAKNRRGTYVNECK
jgi:prepilin-type N-terminal cleavage/methylation domain-containing protein